MSAVAIARAAVSPLGDADDLAPPPLGGSARVALAHDAELAAAGLARPFSGRACAATLARATLPADARADRAGHLLGAAAVALAAELDAVRPGWRSERIGLSLGTSSGGMDSMQELFGALRDGEPVSASLARRATYFAPVAPALAAAGLVLTDLTPWVQVIAACAASTFAIGLGARWLARDAADVVIAGGYDAVTLLVAAGFESLRATTASRPRPFRAGRDGMSLGEGAGLVALVRADRLRGAAPRFSVLGFGASSDAVHVTAPDRTGDGLARAAEAALHDAGRPGSEVALISAHGTATLFNDAMEARALRRAVPHRPVVQPLKAQIGHTLGASGVLETLASVEALARGIAPPAAGEGEIDADADVHLLARSEALALPDGCSDPLVLKVSAAFGGANAALVLAGGAAPVAPRRPLRRVALVARARIEGAQGANDALDRAAIPLDRRSRLDALSLLACGAVAALVADGAQLEGAGIVAGHALASLDIDARFFVRIVDRGAAEPRAFPATSPNICAGHASILFGLTGPSAATCGGLDGGTEALALAAELIAAGDVERVVVVAADQIAETGHAMLAAGFPSIHVPRDGAVAVLLVADGTLEGTGGGLTVPLDLRPRHQGPRIGHDALEARLDELAAGQAVEGQGAT